MQDIMVLGGAGFAREVAWLADDTHRAGTSGAPICYIEAGGSELIGTILNGLPVLSLEDAILRFPGSRGIAAVGSPNLRRRIVEEAQALGVTFARLVHPSVHQSKFNQIGDGTVVCAGSILTTNITLGQHVQVNIDCSLGHDVVMEDFATLAPGVHVSGWVHLKRGAYIGTGANIIDGRRGKPLVIGEGAVVGAGACVVADVPPGALVVGVPAKINHR